jgi:hypothetical protein
MANSGDPLHDRPADAPSESSEDLRHRVEQLQIVSDQLEAVRVEAETLRNSIATEMSESARRQRFEPTPLAAAADAPPAKPTSK